MGGYFFLHFYAAILTTYEHVNSALEVSVHPHCNPSGNPGGPLSACKRRAADSASSVLHAHRTPRAACSASHVFREQIHCAVRALAPARPSSPSNEAQPSLQRGPAFGKKSFYQGSIRLACILRAACATSSVLREQRTPLASCSASSIFREQQAARA